LTDLQRILNEFFRPILVGDQQVRSPVEPFVAQPGGGEAVTAVLGEHDRDRGLVGLGRGGGEGERYVGEAEIEEPVAAPRLAVVVALGCRAAEDPIWRSLRPKRR
jgi:hypothetical protein